MAEQNHEIYLWYEEFERFLKLRNFQNIEILQIGFGYDHMVTQKQVITITDVVTSWAAENNVLHYVC